MDKPISMIVEETKKSLADTINNCKLHPVIIEMLVKEIYLEVRQLNDINKVREKEQYLKESTNE